jgi:ribosome-associated protein
MKDDLIITNNVTIPAYELEISASRASGPGGQHVNRTDTKITVRWNVKNTSVLDENQRLRVLETGLTQRSQIVD